MAISVVCSSCGKRLNVRDELVGKKVKCPGCKTTFTASPSGAIRMKPKGPKEKGAKVSISWGFVSMIALGVAIVGMIVAIVFGPVRAKKDWDPMAEKAEADVRDVVERGLQVHMERIGLYNPKVDRQPPTLHEVHMLWDMMVMGLPELIHFKGTTSEGAYEGTYNTKTLEVVADVEIGGRTVPGVGEASKHGDTKIKVNGWNRDGDFKVWVDGKKAEFAVPATKPAKGDRGVGLPVAPGL